MWRVSCSAPGPPLYSYYMPGRHGGQRKRPAHRAGDLAHASCVRGNNTKGVYFVDH